MGLKRKDFLHFVSSVFCHVPSDVDLGSGGDRDDRWLDLGTDASLLFALGRHLTAKPQGTHL